VLDRNRVLNNRDAADGRQKVQKYLGGLATGLEHDSIALHLIFS
jgi:hypothetical protein